MSEDDSVEYRPKQTLVGSDGYEAVVNVWWIATSSLGRVAVALPIEHDQKEHGTLKWMRELFGMSVKREFYVADLLEEAPISREMHLRCARVESGDLRVARALAVLASVEGGATVQSLR